MNFCPWSGESASTSIYIEVRKNIKDGQTYAMLILMMFLTVITFLNNLKSLKLTNNYKTMEMNKPCSFSAT